MYFVENVCTPSSEAEIAYCETAIEFGVLNHHALIAIDTYEQCLYVEDGNTEATEGVFQKMKKAILDILDKIDSVIRGFLDGIKSGSKNRLTADKYMSSATAQINLNTDIIEMQKVVDAQFLEMRKVVKMISNVSGFDPDVVANTCDNINEKLHDNRNKIKDGAAGLVKTASALAISDAAIKHIEECNGWKEKTRESVERMSRRGKIPPEKQTGMMKALNKASQTLGNLVNSYTYITNGVISAVNKGESQRAKAEKKNKK